MTYFLFTAVCALLHFIVQVLHCIRLTCPVLACLLQLLQLLAACRQQNTMITVSQHPSSTTADKATHGTAHSLHPAPTLLTMLYIPLITHSISHPHLLTKPHLPLLTFSIPRPRLLTRQYLALITRSIPPPHLLTRPHFPLHLPPHLPLYHPWPSS